MCLATATVKRIPLKIKRKKVAWKVFYFGDGGLYYPELMSDRGMPSYEIGKWYPAKGTADITATDAVKYPYGFHCFLTEKDAKFWSSGGVVRRVQIKNVVALGTQKYRGNALPVLVAKEMKILPLKKK